MGFGIANLLNKYVHPALIRWDTIIDQGSKGGILIEEGSLNVDVKISESHRFTNNVTRQTMEDGSIIDQHVINSPFEITIQFEETNNRPFTGSLGSVSAQNNLPKWLNGGPVSTFEKLKELAEKKVPLTITTQHAIYKNMVIKNMPITHRAPYRNALQVSCDLVQLNYSYISIVYNAKDVGTTKSASANVNGGSVQTMIFGG